MMAPSLLLDRLLAELPGFVAASSIPSVAVTGITADSRQVAPGALFVAYRGVGTDGHRFIPEALRRGAVAVVGEQPPPDLPVPYIQVADGREALAWLSAAWHGHPSRAMALVGITGTDGKTTTANLLFSILQAAGRRAGLISTVNAVIGGVSYDTGLHTTTPDAPDIQRYLAAMRDAETEIAVVEATSHGLAQHRLTGCAFDVAVVTNITHEHLDFHGTYEAYREAKALLFQALAVGPHKRLPTWAPGGETTWSVLPKTAVLNRDDSSYEFLATIPAERVITYGVGERGSEGAGEQGRRGEGEQGGRGEGEQGGRGAGEIRHLTAVNVRLSAGGITFDVQERAGPEAQYLIRDIRSPLVGSFNIANILAATGAALALGVEAVAIRAGVQAMAGVPGRMERIELGQPFVAIVDFAHTPNALARALETACELAGPGGRVIAVFGSAGLRDRAKRRLMGDVAARLADYTVVTAEDPRTEELASIIAETADALAGAGRVQGRDFVCIPDRQRAILHAVQMARPGDVVIVCGKGHEQSMCFGTVEHPWRDQEALRWALKVLQGTADATPPFLLPTWQTKEEV